MSTLTLRIDDSLQAMPVAARELWLREEPALQFDQTLGWSELLAAHALEAGERVQIVSAHRGERCVGVLPLKQVPPEGPWPKPGLMRSVMLRPGARSPSWSIISGEPQLTAVPKRITVSSASQSKMSAVKTMSGWPGEVSPSEGR